MNAEEPLTVTIAAKTDVAIRIESVLSEMGLSTQRPGPVRSSTSVAMVIIASVPSFAILALALEKLRRLHLPRTIIVIGEDQSVGIEIDERVRDGRMVVVRHGQDPFDLPDQEITAATLLKQGQPPADG